MARSEDYLHCANLQAELEQIRAHQNILDTKLQSQAKMADEKHEFDLKFFLHRVSSLQDQFNELSNICSHAEESIKILKYMLDKNSAPRSSFKNLRNVGAEANPEDSIACQIIHIPID